MDECVTSKIIMNERLGIKLVTNVYHAHVEATTHNQPT